VGGGFGSKIFLYNEEVVCSWASRLLKRPVRWTSSRHEAYLTDAHGRDHVTDAEMAMSADGKILALRVKTAANLGAYLSTFAPAVPTFLYGTLLNGVYTIGAIHVSVTGVFSNTTAVDAYRGRRAAGSRLRAGADGGSGRRPRSRWTCSRCGGRTSFRSSRRVPDARGRGRTTAATMQAALDKLMQMLDYKKFRAEQEAARKQGRLLGIGFSTYIEACSIAPSKLVGRARRRRRALRVGQGPGPSDRRGDRVHGLALARAGPRDDVLAAGGRRARHSDGAGGDRPRRHGADPFGMGTYGSRSGSVGGTAIFMSLAKIKEKGKKIAAHLLEASPNDIEYANGQFQVKGAPGKAVPFGAVALTAYVPHNYPEGLEPGLEETSFYDPSNFCFPFGAHACVVEVDRDTGKVTIVRLRGGGRRRQHHEPDDRGRHGARWRPPRASGRPSARARPYDDRLGPADDGHDDGLRDAQGRHAAIVRDRSHDHPDARSIRSASRARGRRAPFAAAPAVVNAVVDALSPLGHRPHRGDADERRARVEDHSGRQER
jgi:carbon-monoxide dehydrogenase large subunit